MATTDTVQPALVFVQGYRGYDLKIAPQVQDGVVHIFFHGDLIDTAPSQTEAGALIDSWLYAR